MTYDGAAGETKEAMAKAVRGCAWHTRAAVIRDEKTTALLLLGTIVEPERA